MLYRNVYKFTDTIPIGYEMNQLIRCGSGGICVAFAPLLAGIDQHADIRVLIR